jgi:hypothetical protein
MAKCIHCGRPAGLFRRYHAECRAKYDLAMTMIPAFFEKALNSSLAGDRFDELLRNAAAASYIAPAQLRSLAISGIAAMTESTLADHLLTEAEEERIIEIADAVGLTLDAIPKADDKLIKANVLRELDAGRIPDRVTVVGDLPVELAADESVVWIFNQTKIYRSGRSKRREPARLPSTSPIAHLPLYYSATMLDADGGNPARLVEEAVGDLVVTTNQLLTVWRERQRSIPYAKIVGFRARRDGFLIARGGSQDSVVLFAVDDPWFAANLVARLLRLSPPAEAETEAEAEQDDG